MGRPQEKKSKADRSKADRRKSKRKQPGKSAKKAKVAASAATELCQHCSVDLSDKERALLVEEERGRVFCSEDCIAAYFAPEIERLEAEYFKRLSPTDLAGDDREKLAHLRWITLGEPDEVWREKTLSGDNRYTLISEFDSGEGDAVWCICICLFLRGEPSFLYLAFPTHNPAMVDQYRRGERMDWDKIVASRGSGKETGEDAPGLLGQIGNAPKVAMTDGLAEAWTPEEMLRAQFHKKRDDSDIPVGDFEMYQDCMDPTLEEPDEVWSVKPSAVRGGGEGLRMYHFVRHFAEENSGRSVWYVIVARETDEEDQIEIIEAFPTRDEALVERYRRGTQEVGSVAPPSSTRFVH